MDTDKKLVVLCQFGFFKELEKYLRTDLGRNEFRTLKRYPLVIACVQGSRRHRGNQGSDHAATCVILVQNGSDVNLVDTEQRTALHWAVRLKQHSIVGKLIELGGNPTLEDCDGLNACHLSVKLGREDCLTALAQSYSCKKLLEQPDGNGTPPLILAIKTGNVNITHQLLEQGITVDILDRKAKRTALHYAYIAKHKELFNILLQYGARCDINDYKNQQVIHRVCATSDSDFLSLILEASRDHPININSTSPEGYTPLMTACMNGRSKHVTLLLKQPGVDISCVDKAGRTALHYCSGSDDIACAKLITSSCDNATLNKKCENGFTVLNLAIIAGNVQLVNLLLECGLDVKNVDCENHSLLHWATVCGKADVMEVMLKHCQSDLNKPDSHHAYPLHYAAQMSTNMSVVQSLLDSGADVTSRDQEGRTALQWAASRGNNESCLHLVKHGANVNAQDKHGLSALHCASSQGHTQCIQTLVTDCHAHIDICDKDGCTPVFYATTNGHVEAVMLLLSLGVKTNITDNRGRGLCHCAAISGSIHLLDVLTHHSLDAWSTSAKGDYPIHDAAHSMHAGMVGQLLDQRPDMVDIANTCSRTCLHIAALTGNKQLCVLLLAKGAQINPVMTNKDEKLTPYDVALAKNHKELANYLYTQGGLAFHSLKTANKRPPVQRSSTFPTVLPVVTVSDLSQTKTGSNKSKLYQNGDVRLPSFHVKPNHVIRSESHGESHNRDSELKVNRNYFHENSAVEGDGNFVYDSSDLLNTTNNSSDFSNLSLSPLVKRSHTIEYIPNNNNNTKTTLDNIQQGSTGAKNQVVKNDKVVIVDSKSNKDREKSIRLPTVVAHTKTAKSSPKLTHSSSLPASISHNKNTYQPITRSKTDMGFLMSKPRQPVKVTDKTNSSDGHTNKTYENDFDEIKPHSISPLKTVPEKPNLSQSTEFLLDYNYLKHPGYYYGASVPVRPKYRRTIPNVSQKIVAGVRNSVKDFEQRRQSVRHIRLSKRSKVHTRSLDGLATTTCASNAQTADTTIESLTVSNDMILRPLSEWQNYVEEISSRDPENAKGNLEFLRSLIKEKEEKMKRDVMSEKTQTEERLRRMNDAIKERQEADEKQKQFTDADLHQLMERTEMLFDAVTSRVNEVNEIYGSPDRGEADSGVNSGVTSSKSGLTDSQYASYGAISSNERHPLSSYTNTTDVSKIDEMKRLLHAYRPNVPRDALRGRGKGRELHKPPAPLINSSLKRPTQRNAQNNNSFESDSQHQYIMTKYGMTKVRAFNR